MNCIEKMIIAVLTVFVVPILVFGAYGVLIWSPVAMYTEAECLRQGYPKYAVSVGLERYCMNLDGSVTVKVDHQ